MIFERDSGDKDKTNNCLNRSSFDKLDLSSAEFACSLKMDQRRVLYAINLSIDCACLMDLAKAFFFFSSVVRVRRKTARRNRFCQHYLATST